MKLKNLDELFLLILSATATWERDNREGHTKEEDTDSPVEIRYEVVLAPAALMLAVKNYCHASSSALICH